MICGFIAGIGAAWHLESVTVHDDRTDTVYNFPCAHWLSDSDGDRQLCRELLCTPLNDRPSTVKERRKHTSLTNFFTLSI